MGDSPLFRCPICTRLSSKTLSVTLLCLLPCTGAGGRGHSSGCGWGSGLGASRAGLGCWGAPAPCKDPASPRPARAWGHAVLGAQGHPQPRRVPCPCTHAAPGQTCTRGPRGCRVPVHPGMMSPVAMAMLLHHCVAERPNPGISTGAAWRGQRDGAWVPRGLGGVWVLLGVPTWVAAAPACRELCACAENGSELLRGMGPVGTESGQWWGINQHLQLPHVPASHGVPGYTAACPYRATHSVLAESVTLSGVTGGTQVGTRAVLEPDGAQHTRRMALAWVPVPSCPLACCTTCEQTVLTGNIPRGWKNK